jgi:hypothetical protein
VAQLLAAGRTVVAATRDAQKAQQIFGELGFEEGFQQDKSQVLFISSSIHHADGLPLLGPPAGQVTKSPCELSCWYPNHDKSWAKGALFPAFGQDPSAPWRPMSSLASTALPAETSTEVPGAGCMTDL